MEQLEQLIWLIFAHFIADWALQSEWIAMNKGKYMEIMFAHSMIWTACICITLKYIGVFEISMIPFLLVGHYIIDQWKCIATSKFPSWHLYVDQLWHVFQCFTVVYLWK